MYGEENEGGEILHGNCYLMLWIERELHLEREGGTGLHVGR